MLESLGNNPGLMLLLLAAGFAAFAWARWRGLRADWALFRQWQAAGRPSPAAAGPELAAPIAVEVPDLTAYPGAGAALARPPADLAAALAYIRQHTPNDQGYTFPLGWYRNAAGRAECVTASFVGDVNHILFSGQTDSGKDNAVLGALLALAHQYDPSRLQVCIVDGKGLDWMDWANKAHTWGLAMAPEEIAPIMVRLSAERQRRRDVLAAAGVKKWDRYTGRDLPLLVVYVSELLLLQNATSKSELTKWLNEELTAARAFGIRYVIACQSATNFDTQWRGQISLFMAGQQNAPHADQPNTGLSTAELRALGLIPPSELPAGKKAAGIFTAVQGRDGETIRAALVEDSAAGWLAGMPDQPPAVRQRPAALAPAAVPAPALAASPVAPSMVPGDQAPALLLALLQSGEPLPIGEAPAVAEAPAIAHQNAPNAPSSAPVTGAPATQPASVSDAPGALVVAPTIVPADEQRRILAAAPSATSRRALCKQVYNGATGGAAYNKVQMVCDAAGLLLPPAAPQAVAA